MWATTRISDSAVNTVGHNQMSDPAVWASPQSDQMRSNVRLHSMYPRHLLLDEQKIFKNTFSAFFENRFYAKTQ